MNMIIFKGETIIKLLTACKKELLKMSSQTLQLSQLYAIFLFISIHRMWTNPADYYNIVNHSSNVRVQTPNKHFCACPKKSHWESCGGGTASIISGTHQNIPQPHVVLFNHTETSKPPNHMRAPVNFQEIAFSLLCLLNPQRRSVNTGSKKRGKNQKTAFWISMSHLPTHFGRNVHSCLTDLT